MSRGWKESTSYKLHFRTFFFRQKSLIYDHVARHHQNVKIKSHFLCLIYLTTLAGERVETHVKVWGNQERKQKRTLECTRVYSQLRPNHCWILFKQNDWNLLSIFLFSLQLSFIFCLKNKYFSLRRFLMTMTTRV